MSKVDFPSEVSHSNFVIMPNINIALFYNVIYNEIILNKSEICKACGL